jgi:hypothetical protein
MGLLGLFQQEGRKLAREPGPALTEYLSMDETELLIELGRAQDGGLVVLHSPESLLEKARTYLDRIRPQLQDLVCPHRALTDPLEAELEEVRTDLALARTGLHDAGSPRRALTDPRQVELAISLAGLLAQSFAVSLAEILAVYIVKRSVAWLCQGWDADA